MRPVTILTSVSRLHLELIALADSLELAEATARQYHSEASHIGVAVDPNAATSHDDGGF
jgi:hypothetical protein